MEEPQTDQANVETPPAPPAEVQAQRALRFAVTLHPTDDGYHALLAVGADDCDPVLRHADVDGWPALAEALHALADDAEAQWRTQPRNPTLAPALKPSPRSERQPASPPVEPGEPAPTAVPAGSSQMTLFDPGG
ncbi:MAG: hypothetical protein U0822_25270 [Anaerolineae bacterium]